MTTALSIGDFSRMTQLSVKTLRHYHDVGLLQPHRVDPVTGYRYYASDQVPTAQVIRRLRDLGMPVADVRAVLVCAPADRNALISAHLERLENQLAATRSAVESLRAILAPPAPTRASNTAPSPTRRPPRSPPPSIATICCPGGKGRSKNCEPRCRPTVS
ncbi:hypothetical protein MKUB_47090 [Mycobacterium kubicae]|uniref:HTH merR-type domain-containing protein n=1 Tax=Mycobacterium kubicae TaxID=120959 RepID=A0ABQ1BUY1_9MYCO|nr:helix-turn-helix domain-containing protein [Mycobacterium kubicae]GFG67219.1 hypothetical protein MKUB_47090 [Mycobacterium kubicae]